MWCRVNKIQSKIDYFITPYNSKINIDKSMEFWNTELANLNKQDGRETKNQKNDLLLKLSNLVLKQEVFINTFKHYWIYEFLV